MAPLDPTTTSTLTTITTTPSKKHSTTTTIKRKRDPLNPKPILDRRLLNEAISQSPTKINVTSHQIDLFYSQLHRRNYPPLKEFVETYDDSISKSKKQSTKLPQSFLRFLHRSSDPDNDENEHFATLTSKVHNAQTSSDETTTKLALQLQDGHVVETVIMRHHHSRVTICVSSQVGCAMGCTFCATGTMGIRGNLVEGEILEQLVHAGKILALEEEQAQAAEGDKKGFSNAIRNVVFMGMGEPLNNYPNVINACKSIIDRRRWNLAHGRVTVSTVGVINRMRDLTRDLPEVNLALSLHAPNQKMRSAIVPTAKAYPIEGLIEALDEHMLAVLSRGDDGKDSEEEMVKKRQAASKRKRAMIEYVMLEGDTSTLECAHQLGKLCEGRHLIVNLIPYNQTNVKDVLRCPSESHMKEFQDIVTSYGCFCFVRRTMGADIAGACGQLVVEKEEKHGKENETNSKEVDIEDGPFGSTYAKTIKVTPKILSKATNNTRESSSSTADMDSSTSSSSLDDYIKPLAIATAITASCFVISCALHLRKRR